jgi:eukaryotic-like serine/threonine-protein kinase
MGSPPLGDWGSGTTDRPVNSDLTDTIQITPTQTAAFLQSGCLLKDRYLIVRELSSGGFGKVFLAQDQQLHNRLVVVKIQLDRAIDDPWFEKKFAEELRALALIDHPGVVGALDSARTPDGRPFLVMQYVEGHPLRSSITSDGLPLDRAANIIRQIGHALGAAHSKNIWHRDLKPENIMLQVLPGGDEHVRLIDFGLATIADLAAKQQQTHTRVAGSVGYMAPEQFSGQPSAATDIYAFGVIAYEMITGRKPFVAEDVMQLSMLQRSGVKVKPSALRPGISSQTERLILHSLHYNPNDRPASASAFGEALSQALLTSQSSHSLQMAAIETRRRRLGWLAGAVAVVTLAAGGAWIYRGRMFPAQPTVSRQAVPAPVTSPAAVPNAGPDNTAAEVELAFWNSIGSSSDPRLYREYLAKYPQGEFASLAKLKLEEPPAKTLDAHGPADPAGSAPPKRGLPPVRPALKAEDYGGPLRGELRWAGTLDPGATLAIQGGKAILGDLAGDLPRVPSTVESLTNGIRVVEQPSAANQWDRVVVRNESSSPVGSIQIRWRIAR